MTVPEITVPVVSAIKNGADDFTLTLADTTTVDNITEDETRRFLSNHEKYSAECQSKIDEYNAASWTEMTTIDGTTIQKSDIITTLTGRKGDYDAGITAMEGALSG